MGEIGEGRGRAEEKEKEEEKSIYYECKQF
jgi:hypothetical protein